MCFSTSFSVSVPFLSIRSRTRMSQSQQLIVLLLLMMVFLQLTTGFLPIETTLRSCAVSGFAVIVIAVWAVDVLVRVVHRAGGLLDLVLGRGADRLHLDLVVERHPRQRVVRVNQDAVLVHLDDWSTTSSPSGEVRDELVAGLTAVRELAALDLEHQLLVALAVPFVGADGDLALVARLHPGQRGLEPGDEHAVAVHVLDGLAFLAAARVEDLTVVVLEDVLDDDERIGLNDVHGSSGRRARCGKQKRGGRGSAKGGKRPAGPGFPPVLLLLARSHFTLTVIESLKTSPSSTAACT